MVKIKTKLVAASSVITKIKTITLRPRNKNDYYHIGNWLVSKRLAFLIVCIIGIICVCFLISMSPDQMTTGTSYRTYRYNSLPLKFISGDVEILGKSGYRAYLGKVEKGAAQGEGILYRPDGSVVYEGEFRKNYFEGLGKKYYENSILKYEGSFYHNTFQGEGVLYREDGSKHYEGSFLDGMQDGHGQLFDSSSNLIYEGTFQKNEILYFTLIGKTVEEVSNIYVGKRDIYETNEEYCVHMKDIDALFVSQNAENTLDREWSLSGVYVLKDEFVVQGKKLNTIEQLTKYFEIKDFEGNTYATLPDAIAIHAAGKNEKIVNEPFKLNISKVFEDVMWVENEAVNYILYIYRFRKEGFRYTFFSANNEKEFEMYLIEKDVNHE